MARIPHLFGRDPFSRTEIKRFLVPKGYRKSCTNCGSRAGRFRYAVEGDSRPASEPTNGRAFCSADCWRAYEF
jgi:hypothetical protein